MSNVLVSRYSTWEVYRLTQVCRCRPVLLVIALVSVEEAEPALPWLHTAVAATVRVTSGHSWSYLKSVYSSAEHILRFIVGTTGSTEQLTRRRYAKDQTPLVSICWTVVDLSYNKSIKFTTVHNKSKRVNFELMQTLVTRSGTRRAQKVWGERNSA